MSVSLYFVRTHNIEDHSDDFWLALANSESELKDMFVDEYTQLVDCSLDISANIIEQYGGLVKLCTL